ncbi:MAG TPA: hypothetical protein VGC66_16395 [Pyrinomonadaceae bacterium]
MALLPTKIREVFLFVNLIPHQPSNIKVFRYRDNPPAFQMLAGFDGARQLIEELGAPHYDNAIYCVRLDSAEGMVKTGRLPSKSFSNYTIERFGLRIESYRTARSKGESQSLISDSSQYLCQPTYWRERPDYIVQVWRTRIFACPVTDIQTSLSNPLTPPRFLRMYFEECWHPNRGKARSLHWLEPRDRSKSKVDQFKKDALIILDGAKKLGRPPGTKKFDSPDEFILKYKEAYLKVNRVATPTPELVANEMGISQSTLYRRRIKYHSSWPPIVV